MNKHRTKQPPPDKKPPGNHTLGSAAWGRDTAGRLSTREMIHLAWDALLADLARVPSEVRARLVPSITSEPGELPQLPDTRMVQEATEFMVASCPPWVIAHAYRTSLWGLLLGQDLRRPFDREVLHVAALLHDICLVNDTKMPCGCFAISAAFRAHDFATANGWDATRCTVLSDAISMHMNVRVDMDAGIEAHLLHEGAVFDVLGLRLREIPPRLVAEIVTLYPRGEFAAEFSAAIHQQSIAEPCSRAALLARLGFCRRVMQSPWEKMHYPNKGD